MSRSDDNVQFVIFWALTDARVCNSSLIKYIKTSVYRIVNRVEHEESARETGAQSSDGRWEDTCGSVQRVYYRWRDVVFIKRTTRKKTIRQFRVAHRPVSKVEKARMSKSGIKSMLTVLFDAKVEVHKDFLPAGETYLTVLRGSASTSEGLGPASPSGERRRLDHPPRERSVARRFGKSWRSFRLPGSGGLWNFEISLAVVLAKRVLLRIILSYCIKTVKKIFVPRSEQILLECTLYNSKHVLLNYCFANWQNSWPRKI